MLDDNDDARWLFVLMHKPLWDSGASGFTDLEQSLGKFSYTVFNGHEHSYYHENQSGNDHVQMGTTGGEFTPKTGAGPSTLQIKNPVGCQDVVGIHTPLEQPHQVNFLWRTRKS